MNAKFLWLILCAISASPFAGTANDAADWPRFRGPSGSGIGKSDFPAQFGPQSNVVWKTALPAGNSSPCIGSNRIFLTGFADGKLLILAFDLGTGRILWRRELDPGHIERGARLGNPAASTPTTDGRDVYVYFGPFGLISYDIDGVEHWRKPLPVPITQHGVGTSPVLAGNCLILACDQDVGSFLLAVDTKTGETLWQANRPAYRRGFSTPLPFPSSKPESVIVAGTLGLAAYDLASGAERWTAHGLPNEIVASPIATKDLVFAAGWTPGAGTPSLPSFEDLIERGDRDHDKKLTRDEAPAGPAKQHFLYIDADKDSFITEQEWTSIASIFGRSQNALLAVRPDGHGDVTSTHVVWKQTRGLPYCPSPLYYDGKVYLVKNGGLASCFDAATGQICYQEERLGALGDYYSSPVAAHGKICVISQPGVAVVYRAGEQLEIISRNTLGEPVVATPAIVGGTLIVRTATHLYCFGTEEKLTVSF